MKVCLTGSEGYIGTVLAGVLVDRGHDVLGLDSGLFADCVIGSGGVPQLDEFLRTDVRSIPAGSLKGIDAVIHLAGLSNDPLGDLDLSITHDINTRGTLRLAQEAKRAGVHRFVFASSCSVYGPGAGDTELTERSPVNPLTAYARSKMDAEHELASLADDEFSVTAIRAATVFGMSPRIRLDLVINELAATAAVEQAPLLRSTGNAWRPFVHVRDLASAYAEVMEDESCRPFDVFNVGDPAATTRIIDVARTVSVVTGVPFKVSTTASADERNYRVGFEKFARQYPAWSPRITLEDGIRDLVSRLRAALFTSGDLQSSRYRRLPRLQELLSDGTVDEGLNLRRDGLNRPGFREG